VSDPRQALGEATRCVEECLAQLRAADRTGDDEVLCFLQTLGHLVLTGISALDVQQVLHEREEAVAPVSDEDLSDLQETVRDFQRLVERHVSE